MKKNILTFYICNIIIISLIVLFNDNNYNILLWILLTIFLFFKCGFPKDKNYLKYNTIQIIIISIFSYFLITYSLGLITGFSKNFFDLNLKSIIMNMLYPFTLITCQELIRYIYAKNCVDDIKPYITGTDAAKSRIYDAYNTYVRKGIPAGAICNPGLDAIKAVLYAPYTDYYYFCANEETGEVYYAKTHEEHEQNLILAQISPTEGGTAIE